MASVLDLIGNTPLIEVTRIDRGPCRLFLKLESANPSGLAQGPAGAHDDRGGGGRRPAEARRHHRRGDRRQYRARARPGRRPQGLSHAAGRARQDGAREGAARQGHGRRGRHHALGRRQGPSRLLSGPRRGDRAPHTRRDSSSTSSPIRPIRGRTRRRPARKSCTRWMATSTPSWSASAPAAR